MPPDITPSTETPSETLSKVPENCNDCFLPTTEGGFIPPDTLTKINNYLATAYLEGVSNVEDACDAIAGLAGTANQVSEEELRNMLSVALKDDEDLQVIDKIIECLLELKLITPTITQ